MTKNHDPLLSDDVLAAFGDVLAPTGAADTLARIQAAAKRAVDEDARAEAEAEASVPDPEEVLRETLNEPGYDHADGYVCGSCGAEPVERDYCPACEAGTALTSPAALRAFVLGEEGDVTLVSKRTGERFVFSVTRPNPGHRRVRRRNDNDSRRYVKLRSTPSVSYDRPAFVGTLRLEASTWRGTTYPPGLHVNPKRCDVPEGSPATKAAAWLFDRVARGSDKALSALLAKADVYGEAV
jgi:hypothetical protein